MQHAAKCYMHVVISGGNGAAPRCLFAEEGRLVNSQPPGVDLMAAPRSGCRALLALPMRVLRGRLEECKKAKEEDEA